MSFRNLAGTILIYEAANACGGRALTFASQTTEIAQNTRSNETPAPRATQRSNDLE